MEGYAEIIRQCLHAEKKQDVRAAPAERIRWVHSHHDLLELVSSLHANGAFACTSGTKPSFTSLMRKVCNDWDIKVNDIFVKRRQIFDRIKGCTPYLDKLRAVLSALIEDRLK